MSSNAFDLMMFQSSQRQSQGSQSQKSGGKKRRQSLQNSWQNSQHRKYVQCPLCTSMIPASHLEAHAEYCADSRRDASLNSDRKDKREHEQHEEPSGEPSGEHDENKETRKACLLSNAFEVMMERQRRNSEIQVFSLDRSEDGGWRWHWSKREAGKEVVATSTWSTTLSVSQGGRSKGSEAGDSTTANVLLTTNVPSSNEGVSWTTEGLISNQEVPPEGRWQGGTGYSVIKSALQKAVRLGRAPCALRIIFHLVKDSHQEAIRRLPIIVLEDAILHPSFPFLVWLMAANAKGYRPSKDHISELLRITHEVASIKVRDFLPPTTAFNSPTTLSLSEIDNLDLGEEESNLVRSILLRASFGGMEGDVKMLKGYVSYWTARFQGRCDPPPTSTLPSSPSPSWLAYLKGIFSSLPAPPPQLISPCTIGPLRLGDVPLSSIDFHVSNVIDKMMEDQRVISKAREITRGCWGEEGDAEACLRSAMWLFRSSLNVRRWVSHERSVGTFTMASTLILKQSVETLELEADIERDNAKRERLAPLWEVAKQGADSFAVTTIKRRFKAE
jgi:hypothetical protein